MISLLSSAIPLSRRISSNKWPNLAQSQSGQGRHSVQLSIQPQLDLLQGDHSLQVALIRCHIADFEAAHGREEITEDDWEVYLAIRTE